MCHSLASPKTLIRPYIGRCARVSSRDVFRRASLGIAETPTTVKGLSCISPEF